MFFSWDKVGFFGFLILFKFVEVVIIGCEIKFFDLLMIGSFGCEKVILLGWFVIL